MSAHRTGWWFMGLCAAPLLATGFYLAQLEPVLSPANGGMERNERIDGPFMARQLERLRLRNGQLPCPKEMEPVRGGLCADADEAGIGLLIGGVPRAALGAHAVEDAAPEGWRYVVDLSSTVTDFCHLALHGPLRVHGRSVAAALLPPEAGDWALPHTNATEVELPSGALPVEACAEPRPPRVTHAEGLSAQGTPFASVPMKTRPLPEDVDLAVHRLTTDASGLLIAYIAQGAQLRWRMWDGALGRWLSLGQWKWPDGSRVTQISFAGDRLLVALEAADAAHRAQLADIPLWTHRRSVRYLPAPQPHANWLALLASAEGRSARLIPEGAENWNVALEDGWMIDGTFPPLTEEKNLMAVGDGLGESWLSWNEAKPGLRLWKRNAQGGWQSSDLSTGKALVQHALFLNTPARILVQLREKTAARWLGWRVEDGIRSLPREELPNVGTISGLWAAP